MAQLFIARSLTQSPKCKFPRTNQSEHCSLQAVLNFLDSRRVRAWRQCGSRHLLERHGGEFRNLYCCAVSATLKEHWTTNSIGPRLKGVPRWLHGAAAADRQTDSPAISLMRNGPPDQRQDPTRPCVVVELHKRVLFKCYNKLFQIIIYRHHDEVSSCSSKHRLR